MKTRLNLTIDDDLLAAVKAYAADRQTSVSGMVEHYFQSVLKPFKGKNIVSLIEKLNPPSLDQHADLKDMFYKEQAEKHGF